MLSLLLGQWQNCQRAALGEALVGNVSVRVAEGDVGDQGMLSVRREAAADAELFTHGGLAAIRKHHQRGIYCQQICRIALHLQTHALRGGHKRTDAGRTQKVDGGVGVQRIRQHPPEMLVLGNMPEGVHLHVRTIDAHCAEMAAV